ncbi:MAG: response regulator transcription factor [Planctomycetaceae bacterium]|nr:response regulator transcription factor [Planctomycetaceae bacterium]
MLASTISSPTRTSQVRILVVDDHPIVRRGMTMLIDREPDLAVCAEAEGLTEALQAFREWKPDLTIADVSLQNGSGLELVKEMIAQCPSVRILVCSMHEEGIYAQRALRAGAKGYINKEQATTELTTAIRRVLKGGVYLSDQMTNSMICQSIGQTEDEPHETPVELLSDRELEVFEQIGHGVTTKQIAEKLYLSPKTIETYRESIKAKLHLSNATELTRLAVQWVLESH